MSQLKFENSFMFCTFSLSNSSSTACLFSSRPAMCAKLLSDHVVISATTANDNKNSGKENKSDSSKISSR